MGCDIHCYIESKSANSDRWESFGGRINPGRDYGVFNVMAGLRGDAAPLHPLRGLPSDIGFWARDDAWVYVVNDGDESDEYFMGRTKAEGYVAKGYCEWLDERKTHVSHPDWHSHGWLSPAEFRACIQSDRLNWKPEPNWFAVCAALEELERHDRTARVVFWFDN